MLLRLNGGVRKRSDGPIVVPVALLREALERHGRVQVRALGDSMTPLIPNGSVCEIRRVDVRALRKHDVVAVALGETLVIHRLIARGKRGLLLAGDNRRAPDPWAPADALLGRIDTVVLPSGRARWLQAPGWRLLSWPLRLLGFVRRRR